MDIELIGLSIATSLVNKVNQCKPITCFVFSWRSSYIGLLQYSITSVCWFRPTQFSSFRRERVRKLKTFNLWKARKYITCLKTCIIIINFCTPWPLGVKKWGGIWPPAPMGAPPLWVSPSQFILCSPFDQGDRCYFGAENFDALVLLSLRQTK